MNLVKVWVTNRSVYAMRHIDAHGLGVIANDVLKMRKAIDFQSSWVAIYYKIHFHVVLHKAHLCSCISGNSNRQIKQSSF